MFGESKTVDSEALRQVNYEQVSLFKFQSLTWGGGFVCGLQLINLIRNIKNKIVLLFNIPISIINKLFHKNDVSVGIIISADHDRLCLMLPCLKSALSRNGKPDFVVILKLLRTIRYNIRQ